MYPLLLYRTDLFPILRKFALHIYTDTFFLLLLWNAPTHDLFLKIVFAIIVCPCSGKLPSPDYT